MGKIEALIDLHEQAQGALRIVVVQGGAVAALAGCAVSLFDIAPVVPVFARLWVKVDPVIPTSRSELPPGEGLRGLDCAVEKEGIAGGVVGPEERHADRRGARGLYPDGGRRRDALPFAPGKIALVEPEISAVGGHLAAKIARRFDHGLHRGPVQNFVAVERRTA